MCGSIKGRIIINCQKMSDSSSESGSSSSSDEETVPKKVPVSTKVKGKMKDAQAEVQMVAGPSRKSKKTKTLPMTLPASLPIVEPEPSTSKESTKNVAKRRSSTPKQVVKKTEASDALDDNDLRAGMTCILEMPNDDLEEFLQRIDKQCPIDDAKPIKSREAQIDWDEVAFSNYEPDQCRKAWGYLVRNARRFRIAHEVVEEIKYSFKTDFKRFVKKVIESAPDFPKQPYHSGGFQSFCMDLWEKDKARRAKLNLKTDNFVTFQKRRHDEWNKLPENIKEEYNMQAKRTYAEFRQKVKDYYAQFPRITHEEKRSPGKNGRPKGKLADDVSETYKRRRAVKISGETFADAPKTPSTPLQLFMNSKINRLDPPPTRDELPALKAHYMEKWKKLSNGKRLKWIESCVKKSEQYLEEIKEYKQSHPLFVAKEFQISKVLSKDEYMVWAEAHGHPAKIKRNAFDLFYEDFRVRENEGGDKTETELYNAGLAAWENLDWYNKEMYKINNKTQQATFKKEFEEYYQRIPPIMKSLAVDVLPKTYKKQFTEETNKELLPGQEDTDGNASKAGESFEPARKKKKRHRSEAEEDVVGHILESREGTAEDDEDAGGGSPKKKKKRKKKQKGEREDEDQDKNDIVDVPLYSNDLSLQNKKLLEDHQSEGTTGTSVVNLKDKNNKVKNSRDFSESSDVSVSSVKPNQRNKRKRN